MPEKRSRKIKFSTFWEQRNLATNIILDRIATNNVSVLIAFAGYKLGVTPNQVSFASAISSVLAFCAALVLPPDQMNLSVTAIFLLSQIAYLFDCADGQLARATGTTSEFGAFLDKGIDVASSFFSFGSFFVYVYRYFRHFELIHEADLFLLVGFLFIGARTSRFFTWQLFSMFLPETYNSTKSKENGSNVLLTSFMDHQFSLLNMLVFLLWPMVCLGIFAAQTLILGASYVRFFIRAWPK